MGFGEYGKFHTFFLKASLKGRLIMNNLIEIRCNAIPGHVLSNCLDSHQTPCPA